MDQNQLAGLENTRSQIAELNGLSRQLEKLIASAFKTGTSHVKNFETALRGVAMQMSTMLLRGAVKPMAASLGKAAGSLFSNLFAGESDVASASDVTGFAQGGVFASPNYFRSGDGLNVMGEAGPEAIMPLTRGPDGRLGVTAAAGGRETPIVVNVTTADASSFLRSEAQITAALARAVARGRRGL